MSAASMVSNRRVTRRARSCFGSLLKTPAPSLPLVPAIREYVHRPGALLAALAPGRVGPAPGAARSCPSSSGAPPREGDQPASSRRAKPRSAPAASKPGGPGRGPCRCRRWPSTSTTPVPGASWLGPGSRAWIPDGPDRVRLGPRRLSGLLPSSSRGVCSAVVRSVNRDQTFLRKPHKRGAGPNQKGHDLPSSRSPWPPNRCPPHSSCPWRLRVAVLPLRGGIGPALLAAPAQRTAGACRCHCQAMWRCALASARAGGRNRFLLLEAF